MQFMSHYYKIAGINIELNISDDLIPGELSAFEINDMQGISGDITIMVSNVAYKGRCLRHALVKSEVLTVYDKDGTFVVKNASPISVECINIGKGNNESIIYLTAEMLSKNSYTREDIDEVSFAIRDAFFFHMMKMGRIAVHAASIIYRDKVWAFSAKSGVGKTTLVNNWHNLGFEIQDFNGDVLICYEQDGKAVASGSPWCGTSGIYVNKEVELGGIVFVKRDFYDHVRSLDVAETISKVMARSITPNWNKELFELNMDTAIKIVSMTQCGIIECLPDLAAADLTKRYIDDLYKEKEFLRKKALRLQGVVVEE